jgi:hypothetical protein
MNLQIDLETILLTITLVILIYMLVYEKNEDTSFEDRCSGCPSTTINVNDVKHSINLDSICQDKCEDYRIIEEQKEIADRELEKMTNKEPEEKQEFKSDLDRLEYVYKGTGEPINGDDQFLLKNMEQSRKGLDSLLIRNKFGLDSIKWIYEPELTQYNNDIWYENNPDLNAVLFS